MEMSEPKLQAQLTLFDVANLVVGARAPQEGSKT
jgi:hypothetical protein